MEIVKIIIDGIAMKKNKDRGDVWKIFKRSLFTGEMMHLREVERTFGKGSLRILAALGSGEDEFQRAVVATKIRQYFETEDPKERQKLAKTILGKEVRRIKIDFK